MMNDILFFTCILLVVSYLFLLVVPIDASRFVLASSPAYRGLYFFELESSTSIPLHLLLDSGSPSLLVDYSAYPILSNLTSAVHLTQPHCPVVTQLSSPRHLKLSATSSTSKCPFSVQFLDGLSHSGFLLNCSSFLPVPSSPDFFIIGHLSSDLPFSTPHDFHGVLGIGPPALDPCMGQPCLGTPILPMLFEESDHNSNQNSIDDVTISFCFGLSGGIVSFGDVESDLVGSPFEYVPLLDDVAFATPINQIMIGEVSFFKFSSTRLVIDTGSRSLLLPLSLFLQLKQWFLDYFSHLIGISKSKSLFDGYCFEIHERHLRSFPQFKLVLTLQSELILNSKDYLFSQITNGVRRYCLAIEPFDGSFDTIIAGSLVLSPFYTTIDFARSRVAFAIKADDNCLISEVPDCPNDCRGRGECFYGQCLCTNGWEGEQCESLRTSTIMQLVLFFSLCTLATLFFILLKKNRYSLPRSARILQLGQGETIRPVFQQRVSI
ncbi:hypothetical protein P9112_006579 [Eukaryota sp. TZLM1-RC]